MSFGLTDTLTRVCSERLDAMLKILEDVRNHVLTVQQGFVTIRRPRMATNQALYVFSVERSKTARAAHRIVAQLLRLRVHCWCDRNTVSW